MGDLKSMLNKLKRAALGAHTPHDKATAASKPVPMPLPAQVRILMSQHIGAPAKALVKKGDEVFVGTKIPRVRLSRKLPCAADSPSR